MRSPHLRIWISLALCGLCIFLAFWTGWPGDLWAREPEAVQRFEFTAWGDTLPNSTLRTVKVVPISNREMVRASILLLANQDSLLPLRDLAQRRLHVLTYGQPLPRLEKRLEKYAAFSRSEITETDAINPKKLRDHTTVIFALNKAPEDHRQFTRKLKELSEQVEVVLVNFRSYHLLQDLTDTPVILQAPNSEVMSQDLIGQVLCGGLKIGRKVPEHIQRELGFDESFSTPQIRLGYATPDSKGIASDSLAQIARIVEEGIANYAIPGCQVLVAQGGDIIYQEAFGYHTYEKRRPVQQSDLYDLASITKVAATTLATMKAYEEDQLQLNKRLGEYFQDESYIPTRFKYYDTLAINDFWAGYDSTRRYYDTTRLGDSLMVWGKWVKRRGTPRQSPVFDIQLRDLLTHTSGLQASMPVDGYQRPSSYRFHDRFTGPFSVPIAPQVYMRENYLDSLWNMAKGSHRDDSVRYRYSCINMILMQQVIDSLHQLPISDYVEESFYRPLGMQTMCYNPRELFPQERLVPTASDRWRGQVLCGTVHDPTAALLGGISGNAGLFSNAGDLGILGQMLLNGGHYGGQRYLNDTTVARFTQRNRGHRGLGFDKPPRHTDYIVAPSASLETYGHTGFTGTCFWVDPEHDLVYVFLSNRIHPSVRNTRINELKIRQRIHQVIYNALGIEPRQGSSEPLRIAPSAPVFVDATPPDFPENMATLP
ncbi:MAG: serine hydrolase [Bacteroidota bacterium]